MMPQFDFVLVYCIFFISFFYFISFFFFIYNKLPVLVFFIKYLDKILYYSYLNLINLEKNLIISFPISLFKYLSIIGISNRLLASFFKEKRLILIDLDLDYQFFI